MDLIRTIMMGNDAPIAGQISLAGEFYGIHTTIGTPFVIGNQGVDRVIELPLDDDEKTLLLSSAEKIQQKIQKVLG